MTNDNYQQSNKIFPFSRLPTLEDRPNMPYVEAFTAELTRCANVAPFAVQHSNDGEAHYGGYT